jgi:hypothetical protein
MRRTPVVDRSVNCVDVREARLRGAELSPEATEHARACPVCSAAADEDGGATSELEELFQGVQAKVANEKGVMAWARSRSTTTRLLVAASSVAALVALSAVGIPRTRFAPIPVERFVVVFGALAVLAAILLRVGLRPAHAPAPPDRSILVAIAAGLLLPIATALLPAGAHPFDHYVQYTKTQAMVGCFVIGAFTGVLVVLVLRALDRHAHDSRPAGVLAAVTGGVAGNLALELHCPVTAPAHLLLGHATVGLMLVLAYGFIRKPALER